MRTSRSGSGGTWGFTIPDALFWAVLGLLVLVNVQLDARRASTGLSRVKPGPGSRKRVGQTMERSAIRGFKTVAYLHHDRFALVALEQPQHDGLAGHMRRGSSGSDKEPVAMA